MNDDIKEINIKIPGQILDYVDTMEHLLELYNYITNLQNENEDYKSRVEKTLDKIQYIIDYGFDYDGLNNVEDLKGLIDMLVNYARESKDILRGKDNES